MEGLLSAYTFRPVAKEEEPYLANPDVESKNTYICNTKPIVAYVGKKETVFKVYTDKPNYYGYKVPLFTIPHTVTGLYTLHKIFDLLIFKTT